MKSKEMKEMEVICHLASQMNEEEAKEYWSCLCRNDNKGVNEIVKKYGYTYVTPISSLINEGNVDDIFGGKEEVVIPILMDSISNASKKLKDEGRFSNVTGISQVSSISELRELDENINKKESAHQYASAIFSKEISTIMKAKVILEAAGCESISSELGEIINDMTIKLLLVNPIGNIKKKEIISEDRRKAGKGNVSPHKVIAIKIAADTWEKYPNASQEGLADEIFLYFRKKRNDNPSSGAIKGWLSESGLNPKVRPKNRKFTLVINE